MEGRKINKSLWHPDDGDLISYLDHELGWVASMRLRFHLLRCVDCQRRLGKMDEQLAALSRAASNEELRGIRRNLIEAIRSYELGQGLKSSPVFQVTPDVRKTLEEYVGARMAAQLSERALHSPDPFEAYSNVDQTLRLLLGGKAAAGIKTRLLQETPQ